MSLDIDDLTYDQLVDLNNRVVARLRFLDQMRAHSAMLDFSIGQQVSFHPPGHPVLTGVITKYNQKTVTVIASNGQQWKVSPTHLQKVAPAAQPQGSHGQDGKKRAKVILMPKE